MLHPRAPNPPNPDSVGNANFSVPNQIYHNLTLNLYREIPRNQSLSFSSLDLVDFGDVAFQVETVKAYVSVSWCATRPVRESKVSLGRAATPPRVH